MLLSSAGMDCGEEPSHGWRGAALPLTAASGGLPWPGLLQTSQKLTFTPAVGVSVLRWVNSALPLISEEWP